MKKERKRVRERGKIKLSRYFQELKPGDKIAIVRELALQPAFPRRLQGRTAIVEKKQGSAYVVKLKDGSKEKRFIIHPVHLKKLK